MDEKHAALSFVGPIQHPWSQSLRSVLCGQATEGVTHLTLLFSSSGGSTVEGFALYNLMRSLPMTIHCHNIGVVHSIANIVFLAGDRRSTAPESNFLLHGFTWTFGERDTLPEATITERADLLKASRTDFIKVFEVRTKIGPTRFKALDPFNNPTLFGPDDALKAGIVHDIGHHEVAPGTAVWNIVDN